MLPIIYFDNIAKYVKDGGAVLVAAGPDYASATSLWRTPLDAILPAEPEGGMTERAFHPRLSALGKRHPVTRALEGSAEEPPHWSRWFRLVNTKNNNGTSVLEGPDGKPALVLSREGEGRVALLLSDHIWLWARGFEGGGPHIDLLRRLSHWLMKQPDLEEEALRLSARGRELVIERQTMAESVGEVTVTTPSGATRTLTLTAGEPGIWRGTTPAGELGLWRATDGKLTTLVNVGPANPREFAEVTSSTSVMQPLSAATGGDARRLDEGNGLRVPRVVAVRSSETFKGDDWLGLKMRDASVVRGIGVLPVFAGPARPVAAGRRAGRDLGARGALAALNALPPQGREKKLSRVIPVRRDLAADGLERAIGQLGDQQARRDRPAPACWRGLSESS